MHHVGSTTTWPPLRVHRDGRTPEHVDARATVAALAAHEAARRLGARIGLGERPHDLGHRARPSRVASSSGGCRRGRVGARTSIDGGSSTGCAGGLRRSASARPRSVRVDAPGGAEPPGHGRGHRPLSAHEIAAREDARVRRAAGLGIDVDEPGRRPLQRAARSPSRRAPARWRRSRDRPRASPPRRSWTTPARSRCRPGPSARDEPRARITIPS